MRAILLSCLIAFAALPSRADIVPPPGELGSWDHIALLEGHWRQVKDGAINEEIWMNNKANATLGMSRTVKGLEVSWEYLRLENTKSGVIYIARPMGAKDETGFLLVVSDKDRLVFSNPANDWPQRIEYRRTGPDALEATVSGVDPTKGQVLNFKWTRVK